MHTAKFIFYPSTARLMVSCLSLTDTKLEICLQLHRQVNLLLSFSQKVKTLKKVNQIGNMILKAHVQDRVKIPIC